MVIIACVLSHDTIRMWISCNGSWPFFIADAIRLEARHAGSVVIFFKIGIQCMNQMNALDILYILSEQ
ncbi:MAG: hypothetical protein AUK53_07850 [Betaproteobacteria bacterium CG2_30_59_46]|nr:MAG: hypothetical protein AUK53_07850 [Betaproteobacteria bacterium CG2_30_59_46]PIQ09844.1 MAG: hypothetical protein COW70_14785 [Hydrogenophilales bacterium CG18_big_fil_WC_8_21_14_2_50_58_12]PIX98910.1 MAG: hypothetical protein COZ23_12605 [Hydrogenophilales bacterium CG_4_10_14_3_um_filter_58_23]PJB08500.1 MAG: hypothetical protein CO125_01570 [Hydrogenophilales bacterium CG_4_9_14_3_um_filter_59_35]